MAVALDVLLGCYRFGLLAGCHGPWSAVCVQLWAGGDRPGQRLLPGNSRGTSRRPFCDPVRVHRKLLTARGRRSSFPFRWCLRAPRRLGPCRVRGAASCWIGALLWPTFDLVGILGVEGKEKREGPSGEDRRRRFILSCCMSQSSKDPLI